MNNFRTRLALPCLLSSLALGGLSVQVAGASAMRAPSAPIPPVATVSDPGYLAAMPAGGNNWTVLGSITVPALSCAPQGFAEIQPSLFISANEFDQEGDFGVRLVLRCKNGTASYSPFWITTAVAAPIPITVSPGDILKIKIMDSNAPLTTDSMTVNDGSQTASQTGGGIANAPQRLQAIGIISCEGAPNPCPPWPAFPQFGTITYRGVTVNGMTLQQPGATEQDGHNGAAGFIRTTALNSTGSKFKMIWKHS